MTENRFSLNEEFRNLLRGLIYIILSETLWPIMTSTSSTSNWNRIVEIYNALLNNLLTMDSESGNALPPVPFADEFSGADSLKMKRSTIRHGTLLLALIRLIKYKGKSGSTEFIAQMAIDYLTMYNPTFYPPFILRIICDELNRGCIIYVDDAATIEMWSPRHVRRKYFSSNKNRRLNAISRLHPTLIKFWHTGNASINVLNSLPVDDSIPEHLRDKHPSHQLYEISHAGNRESCWSPDSDEPMVWKVGNIRSIIEYWGKIGVDKLSPSKFSFIIQLESPLGEYWRQGDPGRVEHITALKNLLDLLTLPILQHLQCFQYLNSGVWVFVDNNLPMQVVLCHAFVRLVMCGIVTDGRTRVRVPWSFWVNLYVANYLNGPLDTFIDQDPTREFLNAFRKARLFDTVPFIAMHRMYMKEFQSQLSIVS